MMKKKYIVILASCIFIVVAGACYSCSYDKSQKDGVLLLSQSEEQANELGLEYEDENGYPYSSQGIGPNNILAQVDSIQSSDTVKEIDTPMIYVHLCGAVMNPQVYQVEAGTRLVDIIEAAGGLISEAAGDYINQAMIVEDGQRIYIPTKDEIKELTLAEYAKGDNSSQGKQKTDTASSKLNINTAEETELTTLPGIGQAKARSIIEYRNKNGDFKDITDLKKIPGIKDGLFAPIADLITIK